jgi:nicotinamide-nucleotide amidase
MINTVKALVLKTAHALKQSHLKLVTAESCTGGGLSYWLTSIAGSSDWFDRGFVVYSNAAKIEMLGVHSKTLEELGAVSAQTAREMAEGALHHSHADISIAITGIAGPTGGTPEKPTGTVWIAWAAKGAPTEELAYLFPGDRQAIRLQAIIKALEKLLEKISFIKQHSGL